MTMHQLPKTRKNYTMQYILEIRRQPAKTSRTRKPFHGPDTYVAVQCVPDGVEPLTVLNTTAAAKRGITIKRFGTGYIKHDGPRSMLGQAIAAAEAYIAAQQA